MTFKLKSYIFIIVILSLIFISYVLKIDKSDQVIQPYFEEDIGQYTDIIGDTKQASDIFYNELSIKSMDDQVLYYSDGWYNFVVKFNSNLNDVELDSFMSYFFRAFVRRSPASIGSFPYQNELFMFNLEPNKTSDKPYEKISLRVYINDTKAFRYDYIFNGDDIKSYKYWENVAENYNFKTISNLATHNFIDKYKDKNTNIVIRETFKNDGIIIVRIKRNKQYTKQYINTILKNVETELSKELEKISTDRYGYNCNYIGIVLQFEDLSNKVHSKYVFYNGDKYDKGWIDVDWMNHKFLTDYK